MGDMRGCGVESGLEADRMCRGPVCAEDLRQQRTWLLWIYGSMSLGTLLLRECRKKCWRLCGVNNYNPSVVEAEVRGLAEQE